MELDGACDLPTVASPPASSGPPRGYRHRLAPSRSHQSRVVHARQRVSCRERRLLPWRWNVTPPASFSSRCRKIIRERTAHAPAAVSKARRRRCAHPAPACARFPAQPRFRTRCGHRPHRSGGRSGRRAGPTRPSVPPSGGSLRSVDMADSRRCLEPAARPKRERERGLAPAATTGARPSPRHRGGRLRQ